MNAHPPGTCFPECPDYGRCHCGCGGVTNIAPSSNRALGYVKGQPYQRLQSHGDLRSRQSRHHAAGAGPERWQPAPTLRSAIAACVEREPTEAERELLAAWVWVRVNDLPIDDPEAMLERYRAHRPHCTWRCPWAAAGQRRCAS